MDHFNKLPLEIAAKIITHVPAESVLDCKLVCKSLKNAVTNDRLFNKMHLHHSSTAAAAKDCCKLGFLAFTVNDRFYYFDYNDDQNHVERIRRMVTTPTYSNFDNDLNIYNPKESTSKRLVDFEAWICRVFRHQNTLVSLKELGEEDMEMVKSVEADRNPVIFPTATGGCEP